MVSFSLRQPVIFKEHVFPNTTSLCVGCGFFRSDSIFLLTMIPRTFSFFLGLALHRRKTSFSHASMLDQLCVCAFLHRFRH